MGLGQKRNNVDGVRNARSFADLKGFISEDKGTVNE